MAEVLSVDYDNGELLLQEPEVVADIVVKPEVASLQGLLKIVDVDRTGERIRSRAFAGMPRQRMAPRIGQLITLHKELPTLIHD